MAEESLKKYLTHFQMERAKVHHCSDDVAAATVISGLQVNHDFYASLVKHNVTEMTEILHRAPGYIQLEEVRSNTAKGKTPEKAKSKSDTSTRNQGQNKGGNNSKKPPYLNN